MCLKEYREYFGGLDLTEKEINELFETITAIATSIVDGLFAEQNKYEHNQ